MSVDIKTVAGSVDLEKYYSMRTISKVLHYIKAGIVALSTTTTAQAGPAPIDLGAISNIGTPASISILKNWQTAESILRKNGFDAPATIHFIQNLVPEILADIHFRHIDGVGQLADVELIITGDGKPDLRISLRSLPIYKSISEAYEANELSNEQINTHVSQSGLFDSLIQAANAGDDLDGAVAATSVIGLSHNGYSLLLSSK